MRVVPEGRKYMKKEIKKSNHNKSGSDKLMAHNKQFSILYVCVCVVYTVYISQCQTHESNA